MDVSHETSEQTETRLRRVIAAAEFRVFSGLFCFAEFPLNAFPAHCAADALALVRDEDVWSALLPAQHDAAPHGAEQFGLFSFHFAPGLDNSGFVGWLASTLKRETGSGVLVVCGMNSARGGVFDYWGAPPQAFDAALQVVRALRGER
jgi:hypothetical protein